MKILLVGAGGVGAAFAAIAARRDFFDSIVIADYDVARAEKAAAADERFSRRRRSTRPTPTRSRRSCASTRSRT